MPVFEKPSDLADYVFRITDNGGETADRYTIAFADGSYLGLSGSPTHPQGFSQWGEGIDPQFMAESVENGSEIDLALGDLPKHLVDHIVARNNEGLRDFLESVEAKEPRSVATSREAAKQNDGMPENLGDGIYHDGEAYWVRLDGGPEDDRGPFETAREVILATLPDAASFAGDEWQSTVDVSRLEADPAVKEKIEALEATVRERDEAARMTI